MESKVNLLAEMNGSQGQTKWNIRVVNGDARYATCWREPKQKQSLIVTTSKEEWIISGNNNPMKDYLLMV